MFRYSPKPSMNDKRDQKHTKLEIESEILFGTLYNVSVQAEGGSG